MATSPFGSIRSLLHDGRMIEGDLFETLAALSAGDVDHHPGLRAHQVDAWHILMVQIAVLAMESAGLERPPTEAGAWRDAVLSLTPAWPGGEPWMTIVDDVSVPAFLQPPLPGGIKKDTLAESPDRIDTIGIGRNHDVKNGTLHGAHDDEWLFALVSAQTTNGSMGQGTQSVSRMNGGYASRVTLRLVPDGGASAAFLRDVRILLEDRRRNPEEWIRRRPEVVLWTMPPARDASESLNALDLDPLYVEYCRPIRLRRNGSSIEAERGNAINHRRVESVNGVTRCPWTPIVLGDEPKSFSPGDDCDWRTAQRMLDPARIRRPLLGRIHDTDDRNGHLRLSGVKRSQGATERYDLMRLLLPRRTTPDQMDAQMTTSAMMLASECDVAWRSLRIALMHLIQRAPERVRFDDANGSAWADQAAPDFGRALNRRIECLDDPAVPDPEAVRRIVRESTLEAFAIRAAGMTGARGATMQTARAASEGFLVAMISKERGEKD